MAEFEINDSNWKDFAAPQKVNGELMGRGLIPRDFSARPYGSIFGLPAMALPEFTDEEIEDRIADQERHKSSLFHMRADYGIRSLDQASYPYCWAFSTTKAIMYLNARANNPVEELSGWMLGSVASNFQKTGGWCEYSLQAAREVGVCSLAEWPQGGTSRSLWNATTKEQAAKRKVLEWSDMPGDDRERLLRIMRSLLVMNIPVMVECNRWLHSVCAFQALPKKKYRIDNSWTPDWGDDGCAVMDWLPDNCACPFVVG